ncbi:unnamed protein product, partial [Mesorhabditis spiculigera]
MVLSFYGLLEAGLLILNGIAVLNRERFLKKIGFGQPTHSFDGSDQGSVKHQVIALISAVQTVMRMPLIVVNIFVIVFKLLLG